MKYAIEVCCFGQIRRSKMLNDVDFIDSWLGDWVFLNVRASDVLTFDQGGKCLKVVVKKLKLARRDWEHSERVWDFWQLGSDIPIFNFQSGKPILDIWIEGGAKRWS